MLHEVSGGFAGGVANIGGPALGRLSRIALPGDLGIEGFRVMYTLETKPKLVYRQILRGVISQLGLVQPCLSYVTSRRPKMPTIDSPLVKPEAKPFLQGVPSRQDRSRPRRFGLQQ